MCLPPLPKPAVPEDLTHTDMPERLEVEYNRDFDPVRLVGLFNFADETRDLTLDLPAGDWHAFELWDERYRGVCTGSMTFDLVSPHASRLIALRPADGSPRLVGTTAHLGVGVLDVSSQSFDVSARTLRLSLESAGRRKRRIFVSGPEPVEAYADGELLEVARAGVGWAVEVAVDGPTDLVITFR
jgi:hypothetical protein